MGIGHNPAYGIVMAVCQTGEVDVKMRLNETCSFVMLMQAFKSLLVKSTRLAEHAHISKYIMLFCFFKCTLILPEV